MHNMLLPGAPRAAQLALAAIAMALCSLAGGRSAEAQAGAEGIFVLLPVGARAVGMGETMVAQRGGSDQLWWNPSAIADTGEREIALHHSNTAAGQGNSLALVLPARHAGVLGLSLNVLDLGSQIATDESGNQTGVIRPTDYALGLSYAIAPIPLLALGVTVKHVNASIRCSALCTNLPTESSSSNGADLGAQIRLSSVPLTFGLAARHLGIARGDMTPARLDFGGDYRIEAIERRTPHIQVHAAAGVVTTTRLDSALARVGTDIVLDRRLHVRGGYIRDVVNGSRESVGIGLNSGNFIFDLATTFGGLTATTDNGGSPTYFSLRYLW